MQVGDLIAVTAATVTGTFAAVVASVSSMDGAVGGTRFRKAVAPVYLRRNQDDVLSELPPRLETEEWVELDGKAPIAYREAVHAGNFMAMRPLGG